MISYILDIECLDDISVELPVLEEATCSATPDDHFVFEEGENEEEMVVHKRHTHRVPWTKKEVAEIHEYFGDYLKSKTTPGKREKMQLPNMKKKFNGQLNEQNKKYEANWKECPVVKN